MQANNVNFCLIGGTGRSGTTILNQVLSLHPQMTDIPEWRFLIDPDGILDFYISLSNGWSPYFFDIKYKRLARLLKDLETSHLPIDISKFSFLENLLGIKLTPRYQGIKGSKVLPEYRDCVDKLLDELSEFSFSSRWAGQRFLERRTQYYSRNFSKAELAKTLGNFYRDIARYATNRQKASFFLEKNTWNILWFDTILELLPESKLVHIYRDPRDVVVSFMKQSWMPSTIEDCAKCYRDLIERWLEVKRTVPKDSYIEISLESLVKNNKETLIKICDFWEIPWSDDLLQIPLDKSNSGRWIKELSKSEQEKINLYLEEEIRELGYS